ncbi:Six-hairpin glycosidase-like protein [Cantharellus anzutake]|uniref:Six-hairpin glycosidase-like protein n=1 Tax=Cantharellus anzutake TaxID=1750568 RepID=UPI0019035116|nr:Six-hairpin glycosidase-like protein [Cantharellus anzutake]KAF8335453.1 Six-hairpin glycosidase-like protein [Cantharellus anzutake]
MRSAYFSLLLLAGIPYSAGHRRHFGLSKRHGVDFTPAQIAAVKARLAAGATQSWEVGTRATALLELDYPNLFLYRENSIPPKLRGGGAGSEVFAIVDWVVQKKPSHIPTFWDVAAAGDPPSIGIPALIRNWTGTGKISRTAGVDATSQLEFLLYTNWRTPKGAMSHRRPPQPVQLWSDFLSMAPPFISHYGALQNNRTLVYEGYRQCKLYREALLDGSGLLQHIILGASGQDHLHWSTGNAWAVNGMLRVLRIIQLSDFALEFKSEQSDLIGWITTLLQKVWSFQQDDGSILNYIDENPNSGLHHVFHESSGTALFAACTYRLATILRGKIPGNLLASAEKARQHIIAKIGSDGWLEGVVNPMNWRVAGEHSAEGQAFVVMLAAAHRDWKGSE